MPFPYKRILCPVDFDENSVRAVKEARALASAGGDKICLLHVIRINPFASEGLLVGELYDTQIEFSREKLAGIAQTHLAGIESQLAVEVGEPAEIILAAVAKVRANLVVMATHGRRGLTRLVLGSVAERVVRECTVPVLTVRPGAGDEETA